MQWGFPPPGTSRAPVTNLRSLATAFSRSALKNPERRCLVPVTDFCEWKGEKGFKLARWFSVSSSPIFAFAGVWRPTETGRAYAVLNPQAEPDRRAYPPQGYPVILQLED
jgi:putative SOS response-associated peptidase YedK